MTFAGFIVISNMLIINSARGKCYDDPSIIPANRVGLLLGAAKFIPNGAPNSYYTYRIDAAYALLRAGKIEKLIISGDNHRRGYNEPEMMKKDLVQRGISPDRLVCDYAGLRTLDSIVRAKEVFGQSRLTIISQQFHNERAIYLAEHHGISAIGFDAKDPRYPFSLKTNTREVFARAKCIFDLMVNKQPKFLGERISV
ncbi:MAG: ElyC/SanA/YdcF family protein [Bacillota bacterium]